MPYVYTKDQNPLYDVVTNRIFARKPKDENNKVITDKKILSTKVSNTSKMSYIEGTILPNSTLKKDLKENKQKSSKLDSRSSSRNSRRQSTQIFNKSSNVSKLEQGVNSRNMDSSTIQGTPALTKGSIISGSVKLQELKELHDKLQKVSYIPPLPTFKPRRPTIEAIKSAIENVKKMELLNNKNMGTDDGKSTISVSDASTLTEKVNKTKKKIKNSPTMKDASSSLITSSNKVKIKKNAKKKNKKRP